MAIKVLQALTCQGGAASGCANHETLGQHVGRRPELVACPLESEHRVEDVNRQQGDIVGRVSSTRNLQGRC